MCVACRTMQDKRQLIRIVKSPDQTVKVDYSGKANGRGAYLCKTSECVTLGIKKKQLQRALGVVIPPEVEAELLQLVGESNQE